MRFVASRNLLFVKLFTNRRLAAVPHRVDNVHVARQCARVLTAVRQRTAEGHGLVTKYQHEGQAAFSIGFVAVLRA